jgi:hypothetical protein
VDPSSSNDGINNNSGGESLKFFVDVLDPAECCESTPCTGFKNFQKEKLKRNTTRSLQAKMNHNKSSERITKDKVNQ